MSSSLTGARGSSRPGRVAQRRDDGGGRDDGRRLADALDAVGRVRVGILDDHRLDRRHVERGRDQVVGEARVRDQAVAGLDLLHHARGRGPARSRPRSGPRPPAGRPPGRPPARRRSRRRGSGRARRRPRRRRASPRPRSETWARSPVIWPVSGSSGVVGGVAEDALDVDLAAAARLALGERGAAGVADGAGDHVGLARGRGRAGRVDRRGRRRREPDVVDPELGARDLEDHVRDALPDLGGGAVHLGRAVGEQPHPRGAVVVEALGEADVLEPDREAGAAADALAARRVAGAARAAGAGRAEAARRSRRLERRGARGSPRRSAASTRSAGRSAACRPGASAFRSRSSTGSIPSAAASLSICASPAKQVWTAPKPRIAPHGGLFV